MRSHAEKGRLFRELHKRREILILPNPWDAGTAKLLASLGFEALPTTSLGMSNALGRIDGEGAEMARSLPVPFTFVARAENLIRGRVDLDDTIKRLQAFEKAGADVLYAPGLRDLATMRTVVQASASL